MPWSPPKRAKMFVNGWPPALISSLTVIGRTDININYNYYSQLQAISLPSVKLLLELLLKECWQKSYEP